MIGSAKGGGYKVISSFRKVTHPQNHLKLTPNEYQSLSIVILLEEAHCISIQLQFLVKKIKVSFQKYIK